MDRFGLRHFIQFLMANAFVLAFAFPALSNPMDPLGDFGRHQGNKSKMDGLQNQQLKDALKECVDGEGKSAEACNESTSPFAQAAMGALQALMPMLMQNQGTKQDCNKVDAAQAQASSQMGQGMPGCGGGGGGGDQGGGGGGGDKGGGNNMAGDCGGKAGQGSKSCDTAKKRIDAVKQQCQQKQDQACVQESEKAKQIAEDSGKNNSKMGSMNVGEIMKMLGQMLCQMKKAQQCQKDVCSAPGQLKFNTADPKMTTAVPGQSKVLQDDEGCMVDCNNLNFVSDPKYPEWAAKVNARVTKFKPQCECLKTPSLPGCGSITSPTTATGSNPKKADKSAAALADENGDGNSADKTVGSMDTPPSGGGGGGGGSSGSMGNGAKGGDSKKDPSRPGAPPGPPQVSAGYEGGGGSPARSGGGGAADEPMGKYSKYLPGRKPTAAMDAGLQITGAGGKSIWEKVSEAYRTKAPSLGR